MKKSKPTGFLIVAAMIACLQLVPLGALRHSPQVAAQASPAISSAPEGSVVPLSLDETIRQADAIVLGTITARQSRWGDASRRFIVTDYLMTVEDLIFGSQNGTQIAGTLVLPYWGGTMGDKTQAISDVRVPMVGERLLVMLRPDWDRKIGVPVVGFNQGLFSVVPDVTGGTPIVHDAAGRQLALAASGRAVRRSPALAAAPAIPLSTFVDWLRANIASIKAVRSEPVPAVDPNDPRLMQTFAKEPLLDQSPSSGLPIAAREPAVELGSAAVPVPPSSLMAGAPGEALQVPSQGGQAHSSNFVTLSSKPNLPILVNNFPASFAPWSPEDQYLMSHWNYYTPGLFTTYATPTGTYGWNNNVFDLAGWLNSTQLQATYGTTWEAIGGGVIGVTLSQAVGAVTVEADIALNTAFSFTLDDESILNGSTSVQGFRQVMLHELGHMLGLAHNFNSAMAIMNYFPSAYRYFGLPYSDDAQGARFLFPTIATSRTDLGVFLFYSSGFQSAIEATYPSSVVTGSDLTFNNYTVENAGTTTIAAPTVAYYLTSARNFSSAYYYLGTRAFSSLAAGSYFTPTAMTTTYTVPTMPAGNYYLAAFISEAGGPTQGSFPFSNNFAFSKNRITVTAPVPPGAFGKNTPANGATGQSTSPSVTWSGSSGQTSYQYCFDTVNNSACDSTWTSSTIAVTGLSAGTTYYWQVRANNAAGTTYADGSAGAFWSFTTQVAVPGAFNKTSPANGATGQALSPNLAWTASSGATSVQYCYDTVNNSACDATWISSSIGLSGLSPNTTYYWQVRATNAAGTTYADGASTSFWSFTTQAAAPGAFNKSSPANGATGQSTSPGITWTPSSGATSYEYCYDTVNNSACDAPWTSSAIVISGLSAGTTYYWQVRANNAAGTTYADGSSVSWWSFTTQVVAPLAFNKSAPANGATGQLLAPTLSWGASTGATGYEYCRDTTNDNACTGWTSTGTNTNVGQSGLIAGTTYYWHVRAVNASGTTYAEGSAATFWSFTTSALPPAGFGKTTPANGATGQPTSTVLSWNASSGATSYEYCVDSTNNNACDASWVSVGSATSASMTGLPPNTTRYWQARAINGAGSTYAEGALTSFWAFTTGVPAPAFGQMDTPAQNATGVQGAIGVTGWALDDAGVATVQIYRNCLAFEPGNCQPVLGNSVVYIGDAAFLAGARPDVAAAFPTYPNNARAGWGYLMLTPMLPHVPNSQPYGGQGPLTLYAIATDTVGNKTLLSRSFVDVVPSPTAITMANDTIAKPFGAIDTPGQGQTISGIFNNFGWVITPDLNTIADGTDILVPTNGSTMTVFIDGLPVSLVAYNQCRGNVGNPPPPGIYCNDDVSNIFGNSTPQPVLTTRTSNPTKFRNLDAARAPIGAYTFNTTAMSNGLHTIAWSVSDSAARNEGIGSRFFNVLNGAPAAVTPGIEDALRAAPARVLGAAATLDQHAPGTEGVWGRTGFNLATPWTTMKAKDDNTFAVRLPELGRLELWLGADVDAGYLVADGTLRPLPVGSSLVGAQFGWMPPAGYTGAYQLVFIRGGERITVTVTVVETPRVGEGESQVRMEVTVDAHATGHVRVAGQAFDPKAAIGSGIDAVHVWATRTGASPVFLGAATLEGERFSLTAPLTPGTYTLAAYAWNHRTDRWEDSRSVQVVVR